MRQDLVTYCPHCKRTLSSEEYEKATKCPYCGKSFATIQYTALIILSGLFVLVSWIVYLLSPSKMAQKGALLVTIIFTTWTIVGILTDQVLLRTTNMTRARRKSIATWMSLLFTLALAHLLRSYFLGV